MEKFDPNWFFDRIEKLADSTKSQGSVIGIGDDQISKVKEYARKIRVQYSCKFEKPSN